MIKFKIPFRLPGLNEYTKINRSNCYKASRSKKDIETGIMYCIPKVRITGAVYLRFVWYEPNRRRDKDNVAFAKKYILDALQKKGVLPNDNNDYVKGFSDDFVYGKKEGVEVTVIEEDGI